MKQKQWRLFVIEKRVLNKTKIRTLLEERYHLKVKNIELIHGGSAEIYHVDDYILKLYQKKYGEKEICREIQVIEYLKARGFKVPVYLKTVSGDSFVKVEDRILIVQHYISGEVKEKFMATKKEIQECGYLHGLMVKTLMDYDTMEVEGKDWFDVPKSIEKLKNAIQLGNHPMIVTDLKKKIEMLENLPSGLEDMDKISYYTSHGDFSYLQFIYEKGKVNAIIDFIRVRKLPIVWEIMRSYSYMDRKCKNAEIDIDHLVLYVKEFMKNVKLTPYDLKYMPYVYMCQLLRSTYGYKEYYQKDNNSILEFAHFRTKMCEYLFHHCDEISRRLENL